MSMKTLPPLLQALIAQLVGLAIGFLVWQFSYYFVLQTDRPFQDILWVSAIMAGITASLVGRILFQLPTWWTVINAVFIPATVAAMAVDLPAWIYLTAFVLTLVVFWNVRSDRVPLYLTNQTTWQTLSQVLADSQKRRFIDLGCGLSGAIRYLARHHPDKTFVGVESAPGPVMVSKIRQWLSPLENLTIMHGDIWKQDISGFDAAYCFLSPAPMPRLFEKAKKEMPKGSLLISNSFDVPDHAPSEIVTVDDKRQTRLLVWRL